MVLMGWLFSYEQVTPAEPMRMMNDERWGGMLVKCPCVRVVWMCRRGIGTIRAHFTKRAGIGVQLTKVWQVRCSGDTALCGEVNSVNLHGVVFPDQRRYRPARGRIPNDAIKVSSGGSVLERERRPKCHCISMRVAYTSIGVPRA